MDFSIIKAKECRLIDEKNTTITDCFAQYGVLSLGHNYPPLKKAITDFIERDAPNFIQPLNNYENKKLSEIILGIFSDEYSHITYGNSGAEAIEASIKLARIHTDRKKILSLKKGFHGKTFAALSASGSAYYKREHIYDQNNFYHVELEDLENIEYLLNSKEFAAFIYEPVLGEGGMKELDLTLLKKIENICKKNQTLCIADEIQCGLGRCGAISYAIKQNLQPDIILFSKAFSVGFVPISCLVYKDKLYSKHFEKIHSSTFAANEIGSICAQIVIKKLSEPNSSIIENVNNLSTVIDDIKSRIENSYGHICEISGVGLLRGIHFIDDKAKHNYCLTYLYNSGLMSFIITSYLYHKKKLMTMPLLSSRTSIRFQPPLNATINIIKNFFDAIEEICLLISNGRYDILFSTLLKDYHLPNDISTKYQAINSDGPIAPSSQQIRAGKKFAFLMHPLSRDSLLFVFPLSILKEYTKKQQEELADKFLALAKLDPHPDVCQEFYVSANNRSANGVIISSSLLPMDLISMRNKERKELLKNYLNIAYKEKAEVIGFGAYTSIISRLGEEVKKIIDKNITLTTGSSFTALSVIHSVNEYFSEKQKNQALIIGALGSVGSIISIGISSIFPSIILLSRPNTKSERFMPLLEKMLQSSSDSNIQKHDNSVLMWLSQYKKQYISKTTSEIAKILLEDTLLNNTPIKISNKKQELKIANINCIISATNAGHTFLDPKTFSQAELIVDVARPSDFLQNKHENVKIVEGGIVKQPNNVRYGDCNMVDIETGYNLACLSETIFLALANKQGCYSVGGKCRILRGCRFI